MSCAVNTLYSPKIILIYVLIDLFFSFYGPSMYILLISISKKY